MELIRGLIPLGLTHIQELLDDELIVLAGPRYARKNTLSTGVRHGTNPGSVPLAGQRVPIGAPWGARPARAELPLHCWPIFGVHFSSVVRCWGTTNRSCDPTLCLSQAIELSQSTEYKAFCSRGLTSHPPEGRNCRNVRDHTEDNTFKQEQCRSLVR